MVAYPSHYEHDYYEILGVSKTSTQDEIKREYRKLAMKYHPDKNPTNKAEAENMFKLIAEAYDVIGDPEKRRHFDLVGHGPQQTRLHEGTPVSYPAGDPFGSFHRPSDLFGFDDFGFAPFSLHPLGVFDAFDMFFKDSQDLFRTASHDFFNDPFFSFGFPDSTFEQQFAPKTHRVVTTTAPNGTTRVRTETVFRHPDGSVETIVTGETPDGPQATTSSSYHRPSRVSRPPPSSKSQRPSSRVTFGVGPATSGGRHGRRAGASRSSQTAHRDLYESQPFSTGQSAYAGCSQGGHHNKYNAVRTHR